MRRAIVILAAVTLLVAGGCGGQVTPGTATGESPGPGASPSPSPSPSPVPTMDPGGDLCLRVTDLELRLSALLAVELILPNRTLLEIEYDKLQAAHEELTRLELGDREEELEDSLTRLAHRMGELKLAVEDFETNPKPRAAAPHVQDDSQRLSDELDAFVILSRC